MRTTVTVAPVVTLLGLVAAGDAAAQTPVERGKSLIEVLGACGNCHTPKGPSGEPTEQGGAPLRRS